MKNFKFKFLTLVLCICLCMSILSGCSLFVNKQSYDPNEIVLEVVDRKMTRQELYDNYYSFYQQNYYYFMYYDEETILDTFYNSIVSREVVLDDALKLINEKKMVFSKEALDEVWEDIFDYIRTQVDTKEKNLLLLEVNNDETKLPTRLQSEEDSDEETPIKYEKYKKDPVEKYDATKEKAVEYDIDEQIAKIKDEVLKYNADKSGEDENRDMQAIPEAEQSKRLEAYKMYLSDLILTAKSNKKSSKESDVIKAEIERLYKNYGENRLYTEYQEYINSTVIGTDDGEYKNKLNNLAIAEKFKQLFNYSKETNSVEKNYVDLVTSSSGDSLILYHNKGRYIYFTVQHILISFDEDTLEILKNTKGYDTSKDAIFREPYENIRKQYVNEDEMTTTERITDPEDPNYGYLNKVNGKEVRVRISTIINNFERDAASLTKDVTDPTEISRIRTLLFQEYAFKYSQDTGSLSNDLAGVLGFTISSEVDNHGSHVKDFTNGARSLYESYVKDDPDNGIGMKIAHVTSDYGVHLMMLTGVYDFTNGSVVNMDSVTGDTEEERADSLVEILENTYVSYLTDETIYDYVYEILKNELVGDNGTYFTEQRTILVKKYEDEEKINYKNKLSYKELNDSIN